MGWIFFEDIPTPQHPLQIEAYLLTPPFAWWIGTRNPYVPRAVDRRYVMTFETALYECELALSAREAAKRLGADL